MKKTATILALAGLSMAAPEHVHGAFRNRKVPEHRQLVDPYVPHKTLKQETLNADDDELLLVYKPQYDIDPGMVKRPPRGYDIDPGMIKRIPYPYNNVDQGIFVKPRTTPQVMYADDEMFIGQNEFNPDYPRPRRGDVVLKPRKNDVLFADDELIAYLPKEQDKGALRQHKDDEFFGKGIDAGMVIKPKRGDIDPKMIIKPKRGDIDPKIILNPKRDVIYADDEMFYANDDELMVYLPKELDKGALRQHRDDELFNKGTDAGMVIKPKRGDIDPKMIIKPKRGDIDPKLILHPNKDFVYVDDELIAYLPKDQDKGALRQHKDDEFFGKGIDAGMVIKPKRGDIDPKMIIKPKRGDIDPKIILNPKKDVIYADDELVVLADLLNDS